MEYWDRQIKLAQYMILGTVIITALNIAFMLGNGDLYISYSAALPYYLVWLGKIFDNSLYLGPVNGVFTATGLVMAAVILCGWLVVWWLSKTSRTWLKVGFILVIADLVILVILALVLMGNLFSCLWEAVIHIAVLWEMYHGLKAWAQKDSFLARREAQKQEVAL